MTDRLCASALAEALDAAQYAAFEAASRRSGPPPRSPAPEPAPRVGPNPGPATVKGCSTGGHPRPGSTTAIAAKDLWCSSECTPPCQGGGRGFKSRQVRRQVPARPRAVGTWLPGRVAQLVERAPEKREVTGSTPVPTTGSAVTRACVTQTVGVRPETTALS